MNSAVYSGSESDLIFPSTSLTLASMSSLCALSDALLSSYDERSFTYESYCSLSMIEFSYILTLFHLLSKADILSLRFFLSASYFSLFSVASAIFFSDSSFKDLHASISDRIPFFSDSTFSESIACPHLGQRQSFMSSSSFSSLFSSLSALAESACASSSECRTTAQSFSIKESASLEASCSSLSFL